VSLNLDSDGNGAGVIVVGGTASVDATDVDGREDPAYLGEVFSGCPAVGMTEAIASYSTRLKISIAKVWTTTPGEG
jgi:hypothetical protein